MNPPRNPSSVRPGFSLVEVTLAIGIVGVAILSLVGILGSTFQQVDEIMQTNRALSGVTRLIGALDNPRSIVYLDAAGEKVPDNTKYLMDAGLSLDGGNPSVSSFDIAYRLLIPLGQDVAYALPKTVWPCVLGHLGVMAVCMVIRLFRGNARPAATVPC